MLRRRRNWVVFAVFVLLLSLFVGSVRGGDEDGGDDKDDPAIVLIFMFLGLGLGILVMQVSSAFGDPIPYTVIVFFIGLLFSLADKQNAGIFSSPTNRHSL